MKIELAPQTVLKGFILDSKIEVDGHICLFTGTNGSGKTRLLHSIQNLSTETILDGETLQKNEISSIYINQVDKLSFGITGDIKHIIDLANSVIRYEIERRESGNKINPTVTLATEYKTLYTVDATGILNRASELFSKSPDEISVEELQLSIVLQNELINALKFDLGTPFHNFSQLVVNYHYAYHINKLLKFLNSEGRNVKPLDEQIIKKYHYQNCPYESFNKIINDIFRGKFSISKPDFTLGIYQYTPKLILNNQQIYVELEDLSSGEKSIFWLALKTFESSTVLSKNIFDKSKIILLDEPDAALHPQMIMDFFESLKILHEELGVFFIFTSHSPTTVALMTCDNIFNLEQNTTTNKFTAKRIDKDTAISQLLDGVTQILINPENSWQIYVENSNDQSIYEIAYSHIKHRSTLGLTQVPLTFISSGPKIHPKELQKHIESIYGQSEKTELLIKAINGDGDCAEVIGMVDALAKNGNKTVRGIIDWDKQERVAGSEVIVFAKGYAYSMENVIYDPLSIYAFLMYEGVYKPSDFFECSEDYPWRDALSDNTKKQLIVDVVTKKILGRESNRDHEIKYMSSHPLLGDREYFIPENGGNGHSLEKRILQEYEPIKRLINKSSGKPLMYFFLKKSTINLLGWEYISKSFEELFSKIK
ncbi:hypothetical protein DMT39_29270 [Klebsiella variicola]|uniref:AAA family ATPase n=1 Tax=Klebsiella variicola TaxID=244366 RepID=UPI000D747E2D|nr:AAA family ATPase [Klebsiella variicola]PXM32016.1 hypothetical protein DMT39_29270 [Klebsiella variicola]